MTFIDPVEAFRKYANHFERTKAPDDAGSPEFKTWQDEMRETLAKMIGFQNMQTDPLAPKVIEEVDCGEYLRTKMDIGIALDKCAPMYLLTPKKETTPKPAVIALHGHGYGVKAIVGLDENGNPASEPDYHHNFAIELVKRGFVVACPEIAGFGEQIPEQNVNTELGAKEAEPCHFVSTWALMFGGTILGWRVLETRRVLDYLQNRDDVNSESIGIMGISGGGMLSYFTTALDTRIRASVISGYYCSWFDSLLAAHGCICNFVPGLLTLGDLPELGGLLYPRPVTIEGGTRDPIFPVEKVRDATQRLREIYGDTSDRVLLDDFEGDHRISGNIAYDFLQRELTPPKETT